MQPSFYQTYGDKYKNVKENPKHDYKINKIDQFLKTMSKEKHKLRKYKKQFVNTKLLNAKQKLAFDHIQSHYNKFHNSSNSNGVIQTPNDQLKFQIYGKAGTGKSFLLDSISKLLGSKVLIFAKSGKAAVNVKGQTIQSAFSIGLDTSIYEPLQDISLAYKIKQFEEIEYICIDEISLVDKGLFA